MNEQCWQCKASLHVEEQHFLGNGNETPNFLSRHSCAKAQNETAVDKKIIITVLLPLCEKCEKRNCFFFNQFFLNKGEQRWSQKLIGIKETIKLNRLMKASQSKYRKQKLTTYICINCIRKTALGWCRQKIKQDSCKKSITSTWIFFEYLFGTIQLRKPPLVTLWTLRNKITEYW